MVDSTNQEEGKQLSDGDEIMVKDGVLVAISKFSKEAWGKMFTKKKKLHLLFSRRYTYYTTSTLEKILYVFPVSNGAPRIMTRYKDLPYRYELQPEYASGERKLPCIKATDWTGKTATAQVIQGFIRGTSVVEKCTTMHFKISHSTEVLTWSSQRRSGHGFRVCVNALINKCLKPNASTIPLATDEIKKLEGYKYYLQADGFSAYWSIPVCEESKRLTAFHTPDGIHCWTRLMMGATPSSAVQQTAYLEALDEFID
jgi:hypothetical protein